MRNLNIVEQAIKEKLTVASSPIPGPVLSASIGFDYHVTIRGVASLRKKASNGNQNAVYVHLAKNGYTLEETPENLKYEGRRRLKMGTSVILNGKYVFMRYKAISLNDYHNLKIAFQPKALKTINMLSDDVAVSRRLLRVTHTPNNGARI